MDLTLQLLFTGLGIGAVYALVALGFVLIFRATNVVNFAQGEFSMVGGLSDGRLRGGSEVAVRVGLSCVARPAWRSLGAIFNLGVYYPLRNRTFLPVIIARSARRSFSQNTVLALLDRSRRC